jgi:hypothetical protein
MEALLHEKDSEIAASKTEVAKLSETIQTIVSEKRTDVIKRVSDENDVLKNTLLEANASLAELKTFKVKTETKLKELQARCDNAERELEVRDEAEAKASLPHDEKSILKKEVHFKCARLLTFSPLSFTALFVSDLFRLKNSEKIWSSNQLLLRRGGMPSPILTKNSKYKLSKHIERGQKIRKSK